MTIVRNYLWVLPLIVLFVSACFFSSGIMLDIDDLKYLGIAWGMQDSGHYIIPMANGEFYTDKPPLLFWMIALCWHMFGMNMLGLQAMICVLMGSWVLLAKATYTTLFPRDFIGQALLPYIMIACFSFFTYAHFLHVDLFLVTGVLLTNFGICQRLYSFEEKTARITSLCIVFGVFIGLFAKGPVIYVFTLLPFLIGTLIRQAYRPFFWRIFGALCFGTIMFVCAWVVPIILHANHEFVQQIMYGQIAHRAVEHSDKSYLFYFIKLPYMLIPWVIGVIFIRKFSAVVVDFYREKSFICLIIIVAVLVLTFFGQKRFWYLLPCIPYALIIFTRFFASYEHELVVFRCRFSLARFLKVSGFSLALIYFALSPYFFATLEEKGQFNAIKHALQHASQATDDIIIFSKLGTAYAFNYFTKMMVIPTVHDLTVLQQWIMLHPHGIIITGDSQCPQASHVIVSSHEMGYLLCMASLS